MLKKYLSLFVILFVISNCKEPIFRKYLYG